MHKYHQKRCPVCMLQDIDTVISDSAKTCSIHAPSGAKPKKVTDGKGVFDSLGECCRAYGITRSALAYRIKSQSVTYRDWRYIDD